MTQHNLTAFRIKGQLLMAGWDRGALADHFGVTRPFISHLIYGRKRTPRMQLAIARLIGMDPIHLWREFLNPQVKGRVA